MSQRVPVVRQIAWISIIPHLIVLGLVIAIFTMLGTPEPIIFGALFYLILSRLVRGILTKHHTSGIRAMRKGNFEGALEHFQKSFNFFSEHRWIDEWRFLVLLSSSAMTYREMALCNIAFAHSQLGDGRSAYEIYDRVLQEYPGNALASAAINLMRSATTISG